MTHQFLIDKSSIMRISGAFHALWIFTGQQLAIPMEDVAAMQRAQLMTAQGGGLEKMHQLGPVQLVGWSGDRACSAHATG